MDAADLRPVEALWLLDEEGEQSFTRENVLRAVLIDLSVRGLLEPEEGEEGFEPTGAEPEMPLRRYEHDLLAAIVGEDDEREMVTAVWDYDFRAFLASRGLFQEEEVEHSALFGLLSWTTTEWNRTGQHLKCVDYLVDLERRLQEAVAEKSVRPDQMPMVYAYPDTAFYEDLTDRTEELVLDLPDEPVDDVVASTNVATSGAAVVAASSAASCAAASSATASSACGGAAGGF